MSKTTKALWTYGHRLLDNSHALWIFRASLSILVLVSRRGSVEASGHLSCQHSVACPADDMYDRSLFVLCPLGGGPILFQIRIIQFHEVDDQ